ncbi:MAG: hypothetical protein HYX97_02205 [Chloroflexi bacterium]|nr:hypothetical protein [Chloroflexota bacterium]
MNIAIQTAKRLASLWGDFTAASWFDELLLSDEEASTGTGRAIEPQAKPEHSPAYGGL